MKKVQALDLRVPTLTRGVTPRVIRKEKKLQETLMMPQERESPTPSACVYSTASS